ncbi:MAG: PEP-CTERM sorting domain-containing protein [Kiritimatiellae bacterium]|nr:PEP-CTERM sorting domain-containing protein [Kiritimatiellia bacterium]
MRHLKTRLFACGIAALFALTASAQIWEWTGAVDNNFSTAGNWLVDGVATAVGPTPGSRLNYQFNLAAGGIINLGADHAFESITFGAGAGAFTFEGSRLVASTNQNATNVGSTITQNSTVTQTFNNTIGNQNSGTQFFTLNANGGDIALSVVSAGNSNPRFQVNGDFKVTVQNINDSNRAFNGIFGNGTLEITGSTGRSDTYNVGINTLLITNTSGNALGGANPTFQSGSRLAGTGTVTSGTITMSNGSILSPGIHGNNVTPGNEIGTLTFGSSNIAGATYRWDIGDATGNAGTGWDLVNINAGNFVNLTATTANPTLLEVHSDGPVANWLGTGQSFLVMQTDNAGFTGYDPNAMDIDFSNFDATQLNGGSWAFGLDSEHRNLFVAFVPDGESAANVLPPSSDTFPQFTNVTWAGSADGIQRSGVWSGTNWVEAGTSDRGTPVSGDQTQLTFADLGGAYEARLGQNIEVNRISFSSNSGAITLSQSGNPGILLAGTDPGLSVNGSSAANVNTPISFDGNLRIEGNGTGQLNINSAVSGAGNLIKDGTSVVQLTTANPNLTGTVIVNAGTLRLENSNPFPGVLQINGGQVLRTVGGNMTFGGLEGIGGNFGNTTSQTRTINLNVADGLTLNYAGSLDGGFRNSLRKTGLGTQILSGVNGFTGTSTQFGGDEHQIIVHQGTLVLAETGSIASSTNASTNIFIRTGATFQVDGTIGNSPALFQVDDGGTLSGSGELRRNSNVFGTLSPGNSTGTLTFGDGVTDRTMTLNNGFSYLWEYDTDNSSDRIVINGFLDLNDSNELGNTTVINVVGLNGATFDPFAGNRILFSTTGGVLGASNGQILDWTVNIDGGSAQTWYAVVEGDNVILAIPEPGTLLLLGIAAIAGLIGFRRRRG